MERAVKIMVAFCCFIVGCLLTLVSQSLPQSNMEWLYPIFTGLGFVLMIFSGLYMFLKIARPYVHNYCVKTVPVSSIRRTKLQ